MHHVESCSLQTTTEQGGGQRRQLHRQGEAGLEGRGAGSHKAPGEVGGSGARGRASCRVEPFGIVYPGRPKWQNKRCPV